MGRGRLAVVAGPPPGRPPPSCDGATEWPFGATVPAGEAMATDPVEATDSVGGNGPSEATTTEEATGRRASTVVEGTR